MHTIFNEQINEWDEIVSIDYIGLEDTIDINVSGDRLFYANEILTHNCAVDEIEFDHSHISGGLSKINTADNVFGIFTSRAQTNLGTVYSEGQGVEKNLTEALRWTRLAASQDDDLALCNLGMYYENGEGVPQDYTEAAKWYRLAAAKGMPYAQFRLGLLYYDGTGVDEDEAEAVKWFWLAADQGCEDAQSMLDQMEF